MASAGKCLTLRPDRCPRGTADASGFRTRRRRAAGLLHREPEPCRKPPALVEEDGLAVTAREVEGPPGQQHDLRRPPVRERPGDLGVAPSVDEQEIAGERHAGQRVEPGAGRRDERAVRRADIAVHDDRGIEQARTAFPRRRDPRHRLRRLQPCPGAGAGLRFEAFHRPYKRLSVEKGDELRVAGVDGGAGTVTLAGKDGGTVAWEPGRLAARAGGVEVYKVESMELRAGDRIRWTRNDAGLGFVNSQTAEVAAVADGRVSFRLEDGRMLDMSAGDPQLRHVDRAWALDRACVPGPHRRQRDRRDRGEPPEPDQPEDALRRDQPRARPRRAP